MPLKEKHETSIIDGELLLFRTLWATSKDNMFIVRKDIDGDFYSEKTNPAMTLTLHLATNQLDNMSLKEVLSQESYQQVYYRYQSCLDRGQAISYNEIHSLEGKDTYWETTILPVIDESTRTDRIFGISRNVTELKEFNDQLELKVKERTSELTDALREIERISVTDRLTGLYNRYKLDAVLEELITNQAPDDPLNAIAILDIDHFKPINDLHGHLVGDSVLAELSKILKRSIRNGDVIGRWGGEEFLIIMPDVTHDSAQEALSNICNYTSTHPFPHIGSLTVSIGATLFSYGDSIDSAISRADAALYTVKNTGRDNVYLNYEYSFEVT